MEFRDLKKQYQTLKPQMDNAFASVLSNAQYISGPQVGELERQLTDYVGVKHCITCANGTDAISLALKVWGIGPGDAVFVPDFTFFSTGECPAELGAVPIFVDVDERTYNLDPEKLEKAVLKVRAEGKYVPRVVIAVDLFGLPADYERIIPICQRYGMYLLEDGAQGFGGSQYGKKACSFGDISTTSFFPAKPLGCYGDGGAIYTDNDEWAELLRSLTVHGKNREDKYDNIRLGRNSRLDTLQAAVLQVKLEAFRSYELEMVNQAAVWYNKQLRDTGLAVPIVVEGFQSSWAQYTVQLPDGVNRQALQAELREGGIPTMVYYRKPMHLQGAFSGTDSSIADCPITEKLCRSVLSLPMHPYLEQEEVQMICEKIRKGI